MDATMPFEPTSVTGLPEQLLEEASQPFVGRWNQLVSRTNWEKGEIIHQWREALIASGAPTTEYADETWSRLVGGVSGQHTGRLRRVFARFGQVWESYPGLYWSHFHAAIDWEDAEMWLEGAVQNGWSVSQLRAERAATLGGITESEATQTIADSDLDEDFTITAQATSRAKQEKDQQEPGNRSDRSRSEGPSGPRPEGPDFGDEEPPSQPQTLLAAPLPAEDFAPAAEPLPRVRPFENLPELPDDLAIAFDALKLAILAHKREGWTRFAQADLLACLEALKTLTLAPSAEDR